MTFKLKLSAMLCLAAGCLITAPQANAELLKSENFEYEVGPLNDNPNWIQATAATVTETIDMVAEPLTYPGYQNEAVGLSVHITPDGHETTQSFALKGADEGVNSGTVYASFLFKLNAAPEQNSWLFSFAGGNKNGYVNNNTNLSQHGRLFVAPGSDATKFKLLASKNSAVGTSVEIGEFNVGETYLAIIGYQFVDGRKNDVSSFWINPATDQTVAPAPMFTQETEAADVSETFGMQGCRIYQYFSSTMTPPDANIDAIRFATDWASLFPAGDLPPVEDATLTLTPDEIDFADGFALIQGEVATKTVTVSGANLTAPVILTSSDPSVVVEPAEVSAEEAMAEGGKEVTLTFTANEMLAATLTATSGDLTATTALTAYVEPVTQISSFAQMNLQENETYTILKYTGKMAKVSFINTITKDVYIQDPTGAIRINYNGYFDESGFQIGDKVTNLILYRVDDAAGPCFTPTFMTTTIGTVTSSGNEITPVEATMAEIAADKDSYLYRLVTVKDVTLDNSSTTAWTTTGVVATQTIDGTTTQGRVSAFHATDLIGSEVPGVLASVTAISNSKGAVVLKVRQLADLEQAAPALEVTSQTTIDPNEYQVINTPVELGVFNVKATALAAPVSIWIGGKNCDMFSTDLEEIPAGTGVYQVKVTYTPTATGSHEARINFDATPTELSCGYTLRGKAYDPENPPVVTVDSSALTDFVAAVGETQDQTVSYTVANGLDYGTVKVAGTGFIISSGSMMKEGTYNLKITFRPQTEGEHNASITFSTPMAEDVVINVHGTTSAGPAPEETEGDELVFEGEALATYTTDFTSSSVSNKPLQLDGWKNVAVEGTRAWWSYTFAEDNNQAAKAVAYDSKATEETPMTIMLMSPRLSYTNAAERLLCFDVMGRMMREGMTDLFTVNIIDATTATAETYDMFEISGLGLPCTPDENDEWAHYVLDAASWDLPAEFYVAFVFQSQRGTSSTTQYFIDNFSWGRTDVPFIRTSDQLLSMAGSVGMTTTSDAVTVEGFNLSQPIALSLSGTDADKFELSATELPADGGEFTLNFTPEEIKDHLAIVTMLSGTDARADIMVTVPASNVSGIVTIDAQATLWGNKVSVYDINGRLLLRDVTPARAIEAMRSTPGTLHIVRAADGTTYKYLAK